MPAACVAELHVEPQSGQPDQHPQVVQGHHPVSLLGVEAVEVGRVRTHHLAVGVGHRERVAGSLVQLGQKRRVVLHGVRQLVEAREEPRTGGAGGDELPGVEPVAVQVVLLVEGVEHLAEGLVQVLVRIPHVVGVHQQQFT